MAGSWQCSKFLVTITSELLTVENSQDLHPSQLSQHAYKSDKMFAGSFLQQLDDQTFGHGNQG